jgi:hypothetical protein
LVCPDATEPSGYAFFSQRLNPKASLAANLRELARTTPLLQAPPAGQVQVLVNGPATFVPLAEFQEEDCEPLYNFCLPAHNDMRRRVFYDVVAAANVVVLFALSDATCYALEDLLGMTPHYVSSFTPLIRHFAGKASAKMGHQRGNAAPTLWPLRAADCCTPVPTPSAAPPTWSTSCCRRHATSARN